MIASADETTRCVISFELPHPYGGTVKSSIAVRAGMTETLAFTFMPDPPDEDHPPYTTGRHVEIVDED